MNQEWVFKKNAEQEQQRVEKLKEIRSILSGKGFLTNNEIDSIMHETEENLSCGLSLLSVSGVYNARKALYGDDKQKMVTFTSALFDVERELKPKLEQLMFLRYSYDRYLDSEPVEFDGDIIITDPCYIMSDSGNDDWGRCEYGENMEALGITHYMTRDTIYGDWSCSVYNSDNHRKIGDFCADAGLVSVFLLDDVLKYNPSFDYHINRKWTTALIKNFKGAVQFVVEEEQYQFEGKDYTDYNVKVVGRGINKRSGKPMNFVGLQTGF